MHAVLGRGRPLSVAVSIILAVIASAVFTSRTAVASAATISVSEEAPRQWCTSSRLAASRIVRDACDQVPELSEPGASSTAVVSALRVWLASRVATGTSDISRYWEKSTDDLYQALVDREETVFCGGINWMLMRLYEAFGLDAWVYNFGIDKATSGAPLGATHVVAVVHADGLDQVQDAFYNTTLVDTMGHPLSVQDAVRRLSRREASTVRIQESRGTLRRAFLPRDVESLGAGQFRVMTGAGGGVITPERGAARSSSSQSNCGRVGGESPFAMSRGITVCNLAAQDRPGMQEILDRFPATKDILFRRGLAYEPLSLLLFPLGVSSTAAGWREIGDKSSSGALFSSISREIDWQQHLGLIHLTSKPSSRAARIRDGRFIVDSKPAFPFPIAGIAAS